MTPILKWMHASVLLLLLCSCTSDSQGVPTDVDAADVDLDQTEDRDVIDVAARDASTELDDRLPPPFIHGTRDCNVGGVSAPNYRVWTFDGVTSFGWTRDGNHPDHGPFYAFADVGEWIEFVGSLNGIGLGGETRSELEALDIDWGVEAAVVQFMSGTCEAFVESVETETANEAIVLRVTYRDDDRGCDITCGLAAGGLVVITVPLGSFVTLCDTYVGGCEE